MLMHVINPTYFVIKNITVLQWKKHEIGMVASGRKWARVGLEVTTNKVGLGSYWLTFLMVTKTMPWILLKMPSFFHYDGRFSIVWNRALKVWLP